MRLPHLYQSAAVLVLAAFTLSACGPDGSTPTATTEQAALPLAAGDAQPIAPAPTVEALPAAPATKVVYVSEPQQSYEYVDDAYAMSDAIGDAPPDYGFDYEDSHPWAWRSADDDLRLYEPTSDGDRYYYYRSGQSDPYLVRDNGYSYAYSGGDLVTVYDDRGQALDRMETDRRAEYAGRYLARARALERAQQQDRRQQVIAANWAARQAQVRQDNARWAQQQRETAQWQAYHDRQAAQQNARWQAERNRRQQETVAFNRWHDEGYKGQPPRVVAVNQPAKPAAQNGPFWKRQDQQKVVQEQAQKSAQQHAQQVRQQQVHDQQLKAQQDQIRKQQAVQQAQQQKLTAQKAQAKKQQAVQLARQKQQDAKQAQARKQQAVQVAQQKQQAAKQAQAQKQVAAKQAQVKRQQATQVAQKKQQAAQKAQAQAQAKRQRAQQQAAAKRQQVQQQAEAKQKEEHRPINKGRPDGRNG